MRSLLVPVALIAAMPAQAQTLCDVVTGAIDAAIADREFRTIPDPTPSPPDFRCYLALEERRNFYSCDSTAPGDEAARARKTTSDLALCLELEAETEDTGSGYTATFRIPCFPVSVGVFGSTWLKVLHVNVIAD